MVRALYPGSFDPIHNGHIDIAVRAARVFEEVVVGVYDFPKKKLLFDVEERLAMAQRCFADTPNIEVAKFSGFTVDYARVVNATVLVRGLRVFSDFELEFRMGLANKKLAPEIETVSIMTDIQHIYISSSTIREIAELGGDVSSMVPPFVADALKRRFAELRANQDSPGYTISIRD
ncbi:MAG: pantetheine-phosphate adenylyltransferase [Anaerolineae bacterium]|nr:pantetheine-phosphate adenylyltransferase [Anaerolineae bacterium]NUQ02733.1 pantetheine-phosphate adenylyltransferase [Anaerolineae bacterium]